MSWSLPQQAEDSRDQMTILIGSAVRLLCGEAGVFVVSNEAFDPQSSSEYTLYQISEPALPHLLSYVQEAMQPNSLQPLVVETVPPDLAIQLGLPEDVVEQQGIECCSLAVFDQAGPVGMLHFLRPSTARSCFEPGNELNDTASEGTLRLFIAQLATGLRFALRSQGLVKEQGRLAAIFQHSKEGILTVDNALRI